MSNIRNVCVIAPSTHEKRAITDPLLAASGIRPNRTTAASVAQEATCLDLRSVNVALDHEMAMNEGQKHGERYIINLIGSPGYVDVPTEATDSLALADGSLVLVDCVKGFTVHRDGLLRHAVRERIRPVLCLNMIDNCFMDPQVNGEEAYQLLFNAISSVNDVLATLDDKLLGDIRICPQKGTVAFCSSLSGWGFTLTTFAKFYARHGKDMMENLWGDRFYDPATRGWTNKNTGNCKRGFVLLCYEPIKDIIDICMHNRLVRLDRALEHRGLKLKDDEYNLRGLDLLRCVMHTWLPASKTVLDMMVSHLPSPKEAQEYRVENLYSGPMNDSYANAIRKCDDAGPLVMYIPRMTAPSGNRISLAFGRVFSGKIKNRTEVCVMGPDREIHMDHVKSISIFKGTRLVYASVIQCGNIVALKGLSKYIPQNATMTDDRESVMQPYPLRAIGVEVERGLPLADITLKADSCEREDLHLPYHVYDDLYTHQREGIQWLWSMHCEDSGAILADDMGLGKTRQVCVFIRGLIHSGLIKKALVIAPSSVIDHWGPELKEVGIDNSKTFTGGKSAKDLKHVAKEGGVLLTTHGIFSKNEEMISSIDSSGWDYLFVDEGHRAKNGETNISKSLKNLNCKHKIIITGTPMQNNLSEFYNLLDICKPSLLGDYNSFSVNYIRPIDRGKHKDADPALISTSIKTSQELAELTSPFILRRSKELLRDAGQLKAKKQEYTFWLVLTDRQINYYKSLVANELLRKKGTALAAKNIARDICRHPCLLMKNYSSENPVNKDATAEQMKRSLFEMIPWDDTIEDDHAVSSKISFILYLVHKLIEEGHKILIFSQSPHMLKILEKALGNFMDKDKIIRMDGSTKRHDRLEMTTLFQGSVVAKLPDSPGLSVPDSERSDSESTDISHLTSGSSDSKSTADAESSKICEPLIFLMTTKVGGVGLNLTKASRVIIADPSENPSDDSQAVDRAYRIGQKKDVIVYRLVTCATIEEHIYREQILKTETSAGVLGEDPCMKSICKKEGLVLSLPPWGFRFCKTHRELVRFYGPEFNIALSDLNLHHESVIDVSNHSLLSLRKSFVEDLKYSFEPRFIDIQACDRKQQKPKIKEVKNDVISSAWVDLPPIAATRLRAFRQKSLKRMARATAAAMDVVGDRVLISCADCQELERAQKIVEDFVDKIKLEKKKVVYIPRNKSGVVIGTNGGTLNSIMESSQAFLEIKDPERGVKELRGQVAVTIFGSSEQIEEAMRLVLEKLETNNIK